ncbi:gamma-butyrobetaine dioxygenase [Phlebotomus argentipes]|uniref:gamma-butyrobetaine dioxygenase n=1 Tax=Phlebotomus argentipes TaxID=94469 RepID=UPI0028937822|nr:gamma-butyrobetaine dioxygenase [Phlebotomus argentipes]
MGKIHKNSQLPPISQEVKMLRSNFLTCQLEILRRVSKRFINSENFSLPLGRLSVNDSDQVVSLDYGNRHMKFPVVWLRDNCQCSQCFHKQSQSRIINWYKFDVHPKLQTIVWNDHQKNLSIKWEDKHESVFDVDWLKKRDFTPKNQEEYLAKTYRPIRKSWRKDDFSSIFHSFDYNDVINTDAGLRDWLESLAINGVARITNAPKDEGVCRLVANRVGFIKKTHFGEEFIVTHKPDTTNRAYLSSELQLHTDLPYYEYKPGVNLLHCMEQSSSTGGTNLLIDGMNIARMMKEMYPEYYKLLKTVPVDWTDVGTELGEEMHNIYRVPVFQMNERDELIRINHSTPQRGSHFTVPLGLVKPWYEAFDTFVKLARTECAEFKTEAGNILTFDNVRLIHGRDAYDDTSKNVRYIVGAYLDWDIIFNRLRLISVKD